MSVPEGMLWALYITMIVLCIHNDGYEKGRNDVIEELKRSIKERDGKWKRNVNAASEKKSCTNGITAVIV